MTKYIIAYDFNGVMDIKNSYEIKDNNLTFRTRKQVNVESARALLELALETKTPIVSISNLEAYKMINKILLAALIHSGIPEHAAFANENRKSLRRLFVNSPVPGKKQEVIDELNKEGYSVIALDDMYAFSNCEMMMVHNRDISKHLLRIKEIVSN